MDWLDAWKRTCNASWPTDHGWECARIDAPVALAQRTVDAYEELKGGARHIALPADTDAALIASLKECGVLIVPAGPLVYCLLPVDEPERSQCIETHERVKTAAREEHHRVAVEARSKHWLYMLGNIRCSPVQQSSTLNTARFALRQLAQEHLEGSGNMALQRWFCGLRNWLMQQQSEALILVWRLPDTSVTELGGLATVTAVLEACAPFSAAASCSGQMHEWSVHPALSDSRLKALLEMLPILPSRPVCGELQTSNTKRTNRTGKLDQVQVRPGSHSMYANGQHRPKLRGWLYALVCVIGTPTLLFRWLPLGLRQRRMAVSSLGVYWVGALFHLVPFTTLQEYHRALVCDYAIVTSCFTAHAAIWSGGSITTACSALGSAAIVVSAWVPFMRGLNPQLTCRRLRAGVGLLQVMLLSVVELQSIRQLRLGVLLLVLKLVGFFYFAAAGQLGATLSAHLSQITVPGTWEAHDNFHLIGLVVHTLQVYAIGKQKLQSSSIKPFHLSCMIHLSENPTIMIRLFRSGVWRRLLISVADLRLMISREHGTILPTKTSTNRQNQS